MANLKRLGLIALVLLTLMACFWGVTKLQTEGLRKAIIALISILITWKITDHYSKKSYELSVEKQRKALARSATRKIIEVENAIHRFLEQIQAKKDKVLQLPYEKDARPKDYVSEHFDSLYSWRRNCLEV